MKSKRKSRKLITLGNEASDFEGTDRALNIFEVDNPNSGYS